MYISFSNAASSAVNNTFGREECQDFYRYFTCLKDDPVSLRYFWGAISNIFIAMSDWRSELLSTPIGKTIAIVDTVQILIDINDYFSGKFDNVDWNSTAQRVYMLGRAAFAISNVTFTLTFLMNIGMIAASAAVASTLGTVCALSGALGFGVKAGASAWRWYNSNDQEHADVIKMQASLDMVGYTIAAALPTLTTIGITLAPIPLAGLALISSSFIVISMVYQSIHKKELDSVLGKPKEETTRRVTVLTGLAQLVEDSESLEKLCKLANKLLSLVKNAACLALATTAKAFADFHEAALLPKRFMEWFCPDEKTGKSLWEKSTRWKIGNKIFQTTLAACHLINFVIKFKLAELAILASASVGGIPLMVAATLGSVVLFSACGLVDNALLLNDLFFEQKRQDWDKSIAKQKKWQCITDNINVQDNVDTVNNSRKRRGDKIEKAMGKNEKKSIMQLSNAEYVKRKLAQYDVKVENAEITCNKALINIANDTAKTVGCTLALIGMGLAASTSVSLAIVESVEAGAWGFGIASAFTGVWKPWNEKKYKLHDVPSLVTGYTAL